MIESFEYVAPVFTENSSVKVQKKALVEDRAGREQEPKKKGGLLSNIFSRGEKKPKAHKIHVRQEANSREERKTRATLIRRRAGGCSQASPRNKPRQ